MGSFFENSKIDAAAADGMRVRCVKAFCLSLPWQSPFVPPGLWARACSFASVDVHKGKRQPVCGLRRAHVHGAVLVVIAPSTQGRRRGKTKNKPKRKKQKEGRGSVANPGCSATAKLAVRW